MSLCIKRDLRLFKDDLSIKIEQAVWIVSDVSKGITSPISVLDNGTYESFRGMSLKLVEERPVHRNEYGSFEQSRGPCYRDHFSYVLDSS